MRATFLLLKDIQNELKKAFSKIILDSATEGEDPRSPHILIGHVPPKKSIPSGVMRPDKNNKANDIELAAPSLSDPPFITVRFLDDETKEDKSKALVTEAKIGILCCVYNKKNYEEIEAGYNDILNMADKVLLTLLNKRYWENNHWWVDDVIKRTSGLQKELSSIYEAGAQECPFYGAGVFATFKAAAPTTLTEDTIIKKEN